MTRCLLASSSEQLVEDVIGGIKPEVVMVELDVDRISLLPPGEAVQVGWSALLFCLRLASRLEQLSVRSRSLVPTIGTQFVLCRKWLSISCHVGRDPIEIDSIARGHNLQGRCGNPS